MIDTLAKVRLVVVSWNSRIVLERCLSSLESEARNGVVEVIVVDNASSDGSAQMVEENFGWATVIASRDNLGFGAAVNLGADGAKSEWIVAANADIEVPDGVVEALTDIGDRNRTIGAVAPQLRSPTGESQVSTFPFPTTRDYAARAFGLHRVRSRRLARLFGVKSDHLPDVEREVDYAMGAFLLLRTEAFRAVGGFDERQWMYAEDMDLCWRLARSQWSTLYVPGYTVIHLGAASTESAFGDEIGARTLAAHYAWIRNRRGMVQFGAAVGINLVGIYLRLAVLSLLAMVDHRRFDSAVARVNRWREINMDALRLRHLSVRGKCA